MTQPKDMEQLKKEARDIIDTILNGQGFLSRKRHLRKSLKSLLDHSINKAHLAGRESMRDECVEGARREKIDYLPKEDIDPHVVWNNAIRATASALKKIKL